MKSEELEKIIYAQGWIDAQMKSLSPESQYEQDLYSQWHEMWATLDKGIDQLVAESLLLNQMNEKLTAIKSLAGRSALEERLDNIKALLE